MSKVNHPPPNDPKKSQKKPNQNLSDLKFLFNKKQKSIDSTDPTLQKQVKEILALVAKELEESNNKPRK